MTRAKAILGIDEKTVAMRQVRKVVRKGKAIRRVFCRPGYKAVGKACVKIKPAESRNRHRAQKIAGKKRGARGQAAANMKRQRSNRLRKGFAKRR